MKTTNLTVEKVLLLPQFAGSWVAAGASGLSRTVTGVNLTDLTDYYDWLSPGELLVTTCFALRDDVEAQKKLIPTLASLGLAGVCIKPHRYLEEIPPFMLEAAERLGFPIIGLQMKVQFREISWAVQEAVRCCAPPIFIDDPVLPALFHQLRSNSCDEEEVRTKIRTLELDLEKPFIAALFQLGNDPVPTQAQAYFLYRSVLSRILSLGLDCRTAVDGTRLILLVSSADAEETIVRRLCDTVSVVMASETLGFHLAWSRVMSGREGLTRSVEEAEAALLFGAEQGRGFTCFSDLGVFRMLCDQTARQEARYFVEDILGAITEKSERHEELMLTLKYYFQCLGSTKRTAEKMHTHYNTIAYRIKQVEQLTGMDVHDPEQRFMLETAVRLYQGIHAE